MESKMDSRKYRPQPVVDLPDRRWPSRRIERAPAWCSVDLRDGNQALVNPMDFEQKLVFFQQLVQIGFKEIEVGFPAASDTEFSFIRALIERDLVPDGVTLQVLTPSRAHNIERTFECLQGVRHAVVHLYNSTSPIFRELVFRKDRDGVRELAVDGARQLLELAEKYGRERFMFEYSPENMQDTELDFALEICDAVLDIWRPTPARKAIVNLPLTVETNTCNVYADQVEWMDRHLSHRANVILSLHAHNDRGTGVAATEFGLMAGAQRVEGTLFGNGERTGNADIITVAMNLFSQGIDPGLDFSRIDDIIAIYEKSTGMLVHPRHPYAGSLVFTAFSGTHQDAINKALAEQKKHPGVWRMPYLPIDPADLGRSYEPIIRINSQSGKGGVTFILEQNYGLHLPRPLQIDFGGVVNRSADKNGQGGGEMAKEAIYQLFQDTYIREEPLSLVSYQETINGASDVTAVLWRQNSEQTISGHGNGLMDAFCDGLRQALSISFDIVNYAEHSLEESSASRAITYVELSSGGKSYFGAGVSGSIGKSSLRAVVSAVNQILHHS